MIAIIDYGIGNLASISNTLNRLKIKSLVTADPVQIQEAGGLILPGVGAAGEGMNNLKNNGLDKLIVCAISRGKPFLGICLGMQLLFEKSEEGDTKCLGILRGTVRKFQKKRKVPQIGWNEIRSNNAEFRIKNLFKDIPDKSYFYFVNSYYCVPEDKSMIAAETEYGETFASIIARDNVVATQFHPEKSGLVGQQLLINWIKTLK